ncbi:MAG: metalloregulator ArsR/SmtB family transcription factor [Chloroflexi bacterium]|nr:metalloregulator ArsR/SmtB family transcription factor [Chloroflexota bacterium]
MTATAAQVLEALGDPQRRKIVQILLQSPAPVRRIADQLPISRPAVSRHLRQLKQAGLVLDEPAGTRRIYRLHNEGLQALREYLDAMWQGSLASFADAVESDVADQRPDRDR